MRWHYGIVPTEIRVKRIWKLTGHTHHDRPRFEQRPTLQTNPGSRKRFSPSSFNIGNISTKIDWDWYLDRGICEPAKGKGNEFTWSRAICYNHAVPPDLNDKSGDNSRSNADCICDWRERKEPRCDGDCCHWWTFFLPRLNAVCYPRDVHVILTRKEERKCLIDV